MGPERDSFPNALCDEIYRCFVKVIDDNADDIISPLRRGYAVVPEMARHDLRTLQPLPPLRTAHTEALLGGAYRAREIAVRQACSGIGTIIGRLPIANRHGAVSE